jgi:RHS repeat-associated protein
VAKRLELKMPTTNFIWDELSDNVLLESDDSDVVTAAYVNRPEQFGELLSQDRSGAKSFFHYDGESSTSALTDANENISDTFIYTAYGEEVARTGTTTNPFGYKGAVGYYMDESASDIYVRNRTYEPTIGRWLSTDPLGFVDGTSLYRAYFVPIGVDPSGELQVKANPNWGSEDLECGEAYGVTFMVSLDDWKNNTPNSVPLGDDRRGGYFIQQLLLTCFVEDCETGSFAAVIKTVYEVFPAKVPYGRTDAPKGNGDKMTFVSLDGKKGRKSVVAETRFVPASKFETPANKTNFTTGKGYGVGDCVFSAPYMRSDDSVPDGWHDYVKAEGTHLRRFTLEWDCCCEDRWAKGEHVEYKF